MIKFILQLFYTTLNTNELCSVHYSFFLRRSIEVLTGRAKLDFTESKSWWNFRPNESERQ